MRNSPAALRANAEEIHMAQEATTIENTAPANAPEALVTWVAGVAELTQPDARRTGATARAPSATALCARWSPRASSSS